MPIKEQLGKAVDHYQADPAMQKQVGDVSQAPTEKVSKVDANYRVADTPEESCGTCVHFDNHGGCEIVAGHINISHVSDHYSSTKGKGSDGTSDNSA